MEDVASLPAGFIPLPSRAPDSSLRPVSVLQAQARPLPESTDTKLRGTASFYWSSEQGAVTPGPLQRMGNSFAGPGMTSLQGCSPKGRQMGGTNGLRGL